MTAGDDRVLVADAATIRFARRLRLQALLRQLRDDGCGHVIDLTDPVARALAPGTLAVVDHARELGLTDRGPARGLAGGPHGRRGPAGA